MNAEILFARVNTKNAKCRYEEKIPVFQIRIDQMRIPDQNSAFSAMQILDPDKKNIK